MRGESHAGEVILLHQGSQAGTLSAHSWMLKGTAEHTAHQECPVDPEPTGDGTCPGSDRPFPQVPLTNPEGRM